MDPDELLTLEEIARALKVSTKSVERWEKDGDFPAGFKLSAHEKRWTRRVFRRWLREKMKGKGPNLSDTEGH